MPGAFYRLSLKDNSREIGRTEFHIGDLTGVSLPGALAQMGTLQTAIEGVSLGTVAGSGWGDNDNFAVDPPASTLAQRGTKWTLVGRDDVTGVPVINHIPTADLTLLVSGSEDLVLTGGPGAALKTAYEALVKSPAGNALVLERVYYSD